MQGRVKLRKTLSDCIVGGEDDVWLSAGTMIDKFVFYTVLFGPRNVNESKENYTTLNYIKVSFFLYKLLVNHFLFMTYMFLLRIYTYNYSIYYVIYLNIFIDK